MDLRLRNIYASLRKAGLDGLILSHPENITYLSRYRSRDSYLLISRKQNIYFTDSRYTEEAKNNLKAFSIQEIHGPAFGAITQAALSLGLRNIGFEERYLAFDQYKKLKESLEEKARLAPTYGLIEEYRQIKNSEELEKIKKATQITVEALRFASSLIKTNGIREAEVAGELERFIRYNGGHTSAFDIIVASGANSSFPHHLTSHKRVQEGEPVLIDIGVDYAGYKSDLTRVLFSDRISSTFRKVYSIVRKAQDRAIREVKPGVFINKIDAAARQYIASKGYGGFFSHSLGHGIGLEVHEEPRIAEKEKNKLKTGMVFTVEPAIYLPGKFGIRIEDMVLVTRKGCEVISGALNQ
ncbi:MAG: Xaa-Pro peptidase family protein [Candidatus Omnitrophota bacterium]